MMDALHKRMKEGLQGYRGLKNYIKLLVATVVALLLIQLLFKMPSPLPFFEAEWSAGEALNFFGCIIGAYAAIAPVAKTLTVQQDNRRDDLRRSICPLLVMSLPTSPRQDGKLAWLSEDDQMKQREVEKYKDVDLRIALVADGSECHINYPEHYSSEINSKIDACLLFSQKTRDESGIEYIHNAPREHFFRINVTNLGAGPAINVAFYIERDGAVGEEICGKHCHTPTKQLPIGEVLSIGVFYDAQVPQAKSSYLVARYSDRDSRMYLQKHALLQTQLGRSNDKVVQFDLKINQVLSKDV